MTGALILCSCFCMVVGYSLWVLRSNRLNFYREQLAAKTLAVAEHSTLVFRAADVALRDTRAEIASGHWPTGTTTTRDALRARLAGLMHVRELRLIGDDNQLVVSTAEQPPAATNPALLEEARRQPERPYFSERKGQGIDAHPTQLALGLRGVRGGGPAGRVMVATIDDHFLRDFFTQLEPGRDTSFTLLHRNGTVVSGDPDTYASIMADGHGPLDDRHRVSTTWRGGRVVAVAPVGDYPLLVVTSRLEGEVLLVWRQLAMEVSAVTGGLTLLVLLLVVRFNREWRARLAIQAELSERQERASLAFHAAREGVWDWDPLLDQLYLSARMRVLLGLPPDPPTTAPLGWWALHQSIDLHPEDVEPLREAVTNHLEARSERFDVCYRVRHADGRWHTIHLRGQATRGADGRVQRLVGTAFDETDSREAAEHTRRLELQLQRTHKLQSLGTLAGGIAHDFNNILAAVIGYGEMARHVAPAGSAQERHLDQVLQAGQRGRALVERILAFSRSGLRQQSNFQPERVVGEVLDLLAGSLRADIRLKRDLRAAEAIQSGDPTLFFEVVMNLCTNAIQAMPDGGTLTVRLAEQTVETQRLLAHGEVEPGRYLVLTVDDTGVGMTPAVLERIFEPFYTTKAPQAGTGLGLAVVHGMVADSAGAIDIETAPGKGTCFTLYLPAHRPGAKAEAGRRVGSETVPLGNGEVVLVVDDEPSLVALAEELLASLGYEPVGFSSSAAALAEVRASPDRFDLVLTDQVMPELTGTELAVAIRRRRPDIPILLASGYGGPQLGERAAAAGIDRVVTKPLRAAELARVIAQMLETHRRQLEAAQAASGRVPVLAEPSTAVAGIASSTSPG